LSVPFFPARGRSLLSPAWGESLLFYDSLPDKGERPWVTPGSALPGRAMARHIPLREGIALASLGMERATQPALGPPGPGCRQASRRYYMLEACRLYCDRGYMKICLKRVPPIVEYGGTILKTSPHKLDQERCSKLRESRPSPSSSSGIHKAKLCS
jgi:hypothetical protein